MKQESIKILVVDDEPDLEVLMRQRMRRDIRSGRYSFAFAANGAEALEVLRAQDDIDVVLSDINMPKMDGLTMLSEIAKMDPDMRAVMVSAYGDIENIRSAMNLGAFDFVTKPVDFADLRRTLDRTIENLQSWRAALLDRHKLMALQNELSVARNMQQSILPKEFPVDRRYSMYADMEPAREVGGDFYDIHSLPDNRVGFAIADVSGKGVPAALFMMSARTLLKGSALMFNTPEKILAETNSILSDDNEAMMFVTVWYAIYDPESRELSFANGGHNPPLLVHPDGSSKMLQSDTGVPLGIVGRTSFEQVSIELDVGDTLVLYTDGVNEAENQDRDLYGMDRFQALFQGREPFASGKEANDAVFEAVHEFAAGAEQSDDITCLTLLVKPDA
ncbi:MAG: SpoIIE family protein phosphatase [Pseudomonadales bacterium]|nr:SpoIIE family protein phosphatase [Pseudomonadales bacterium]